MLSALSEFHGFNTMCKHFRYFNYQSVIEIDWLFKQSYEYIITICKQQSSTHSHFVFCLSSDDGCSETLSTCRRSLKKKKNYDHLHTKNPTIIILICKRDMTIFLILVKIYRLLINYIQTKRFYNLNY